MSAEYDAAIEVKAGLDNIANELPTLRQLYAGMAMQGLMAGPHHWLEDSMEANTQAAARIAVATADALIAELNKNSP